MRILDGYCGVGGAAMGLHRAFPNAEIDGIDIVEQPQYPFNFLKHDILPLLTPGNLRQFDLVWMSPVCKGYSKATSYRDRSVYADHIAEVRFACHLAGVPFVIENTDGAPIRRDVTICGQQVGLPRLYRHRHFECSFPIRKMPHSLHVKTVGWNKEDIVTVAGHGIDCPSDLWTWREVMGIDWARNRDQLAQAVPPAYSQWVAEQYKLACQDGSVV